MAATATSTDADASTDDPAARPVPAKAATNGGVPRARKPAAPKAVDLSARIAEAAGDPFVFRLPDGSIHELPPIKDALPVSAILALKGGDMGQLDQLDDASGNQLLGLSIAALEVVVQAWFEHGGLDPGEQLASAGSSSDTGTGSRPTSASSTPSTSGS